MYNHSHQCAPGLHPRPGYRALHRLHDPGVIEKHAIGCPMPRLLLRLSLLLLFLVPFSPSAPKAEEMQVIAIVNDDIITSQDLKDRINLVLKMTGLPDNAEVRSRLTAQIMQKL